MRRKLLLPPRGYSRTFTLRQVKNFIAKVEVDAGGCWIWTGYRDANGYGQVKIHGMARSAHRVSYAIFKGRIRNGNEIDHRCGNHACVCPWHLQQLTKHDNSADGGRRRHEYEDLTI